MKLKEYLNNLIEMVKKNPEIEEYDVIYASDNEGNDFKPVIFTPTIMKVLNEGDYSLEVETQSESPNAICIN